MYTRIKFYISVILRDPVTMNWKPRRSSGHIFLVQGTVRPESSIVSWESKVVSAQPVFRTLRPERKTCCPVYKVFVDPA
jgi:hypothetical protein